MTRYATLYNITRLLPSELMAVEIACDELRSYAEVLEHDHPLDKADYEKYQWAVRKLTAVLARAATHADVLR